MDNAIPFFQGCVLPDGQTFDALPEQSLLKSMEQGGVSWPWSCRSGTCRTCMGQLLKGRVRYKMEWPGLSMEEKQEGWILPCVAHPLGDVVMKDPLSD
jgi:ferredoxin